MFFQHPKNNVTNYWNQLYIGIFLYRCETIPNFFLLTFISVFLSVIVCRRAVLRHEAETETRIRRVSREGEENRTPSLSLSPGTPTGRADSLRYRTALGEKLCRGSGIGIVYSGFGSVSGTVDLVLYVKVRVMETISRGPTLTYLDTIL